MSSFWDSVWEQVDSGGEALTKHGGNLIDLYSGWKDVRQPEDVDDSAKTDSNQPETQSGPLPASAGYGLGGQLPLLLALGLGLVVILELRD